MQRLSVKVSVSCFSTGECIYLLCVFSDPATTLPGNCSTGDVRLIGPTNLTTGTAEGRVEVCINNAWGTVCGNSFTFEDAGTICVNLGGFNRSGV